MTSRQSSFRQSLNLSERLVPKAHQSKDTDKMQTPAIRRRIAVAQRLISCYFYMASDESAENVRAAYEANFQRLVAVKRKYDPINFFSGNQNIAP